MIFIKTLYFEPFSGISGDMALGAMLDLGLDHAEFLKRMKDLCLSEYSIEIKKDIKSGISGTRVVIETHEHHEPHDASHHNLEINHDHDMDEYNKHIELHEHNSHNHRSYKDIQVIIINSFISERAKEFSLRVFDKLAEAEGRIHNVAKSDVTFHEVGAVDSIVDIVGFSVCLDMINAERFFVSPVNVGGGSVKTRHGKLPVPAPATLEVLKNIPIYSSGIYGELTTPTGGAIVSSFCEPCTVFPEMEIEKIGYGLGKRDYEFPNCLRVSLGKLYNQDNQKNKVVIIESNIDDMSGEFFGFVMEKLFQLNVMDVWFTPIFMKKNRPAIKLSVMCLEKDINIVSNLILRETTTNGVRYNYSYRNILDRFFVMVETAYGPIKVKVSGSSDVVSKAIPEYEDCKNASEKADVPIRTVYEAALNEYYKNPNINDKY